MGFFDGALGNLVTSAENGKGAMFVMNLVQEAGGLPKIIDMFNQSGLANEVSSWLGNGNKLPISAEQIQQVFSPDLIQSVASKFGIPADEANGLIAKILPGVVSHLTPEGSVPENHSDLLSQGMSMLKGFNL